MRSNPTSRTRLFVDGVYETGARLSVGGSDAHKLRDVLRLQSGDAIEIVDSAASCFDARLELNGHEVFAQLLRKHDPAVATTLCIDVAQGVPKGQKMDFVVEKLTELGVNAIVPLQSERAIVRDPGEGKVERWRRLARTAAQQCGRTALPVITGPESFDGLLTRFADYAAVLFPWELAEARPLREALAALPAGRILVVVGPEGGFSHEEAERAQAAGARLVSLGSRILRTETAALVAVVALQYQAGHL